VTKWEPDIPACACTQDATKWFCMESLTYAEKIMVAAIMVAESISVRSFFFTKAFVGNATCLDFDTYIN